jgi:hypothetical protein
MPALIVALSIGMGRLAGLIYLGENSRFAENTRPCGNLAYG